MLPKSKRATRAIFSTKPVKRVAFAFGTASLYPGTPPRVAVVVSKKLARTAPVRNRLRRRVYSALHTIVPALKMSVVVYPTRAALTAPLSELRTALAESLVLR